MSPNLTLPADLGTAPLVSIREGGVHPPLFFFHGVAGNIPRFNNLIRYLGPQEGIYLLQETDLRGDEPIFTTIEDMAAYYIKVIQIVQKQGPYFLIGYSFSGLIAFEAAQQLHRQGHKVALVALIDAGQPLYRKDYLNVLLSPKMLAAYIRRLVELLGDPDSRSTVWLRVRNELWRLFFLKLRRKGAVPSQSDNPPALPRTAAALQAAKLQAAGKYTPKPYPGRLSVFRVEERITVDKFDRFLGWKGLADYIDVYDVPGDHVTVAEEPRVAALAEKLELAVELARASN